jgi:hypothetical protein
MKNILEPRNKISVTAVLLTIAGAAAIIASCPDAKAELGDTYAQSVRVLGRPSGTKSNIVWWRPINENRTWLGETFYHNQCVAVFYTPPAGRNIFESEVWRLLQKNSRPGTIWTQYNRDSEGLEYANGDATLYAKWVFKDGTLRVCYASYLNRHGLLDKQPSEDRPPVEDSDGISLNGDSYTGKDWTDSKRYLS